MTTKNKQLKFTAALLIFSIFIYCILPINTTAAINSTLKNLREYKNAPFYNNIIFLRENNIDLTDSKGRFDPAKEITRAEFVRYLMKALQFTIVNKESYSDTKKHDYAKYINTAYANSVIPTSYFGTNFKPNQKTTKYETAFMAVNALKLPIYTKTENIYSNYSSRNINALSDCYIIFGVEEGKNYNFYANDKINAAEIADMLARIIKYKKSPYEYKADAILEFADTHTIKTQAQFFDVVWAMAEKRLTSYDFRFSLSDSALNDVVTSFIALKPEYSITGASFTIYNDIKHKNTLELSYLSVTNSIKKDWDAINTEVKKFKEKYITSKMSDYEKLKAIHDYLVISCEYDVSVRNTNIFSKAHTAYGALIEKKAVCQGYAAAFNIIARELGIMSIGVWGTPPKSSENHMWNAVLVDGKIYYIDATWDDPVPDVKGKVNYTYFWRTESEFKTSGYKWRDIEKVSSEYFAK